jgi:hypothetical protein
MGKRVLHFSDLAIDGVAFGGHDQILAKDRKGQKHQHYNK